MKNLNCTQCGFPRKIGRRICDACNKERLNNFVRSNPRYTWSNICFICKDVFNSYRKTKRLCAKCRTLTDSLKCETISTNNYVKVGAADEHRIIAEFILGRTLSYNEIIHHIDDNPKNNVRKNLALMSRETHGSLHLFLDVMKAFCQYHDGLDFFYRNVKDLTKQWSLEVNKEIIFL